jgi:hypothetical protein
VRAQHRHRAEVTHSRVVPCAPHECLRARARQGSVPAQWHVRCHGCLLVTLLWQRAGPRVARWHALRSTCVQGTHPQRARPVCLTCVLQPPAVPCAGIVAWLMAYGIGANGAWPPSGPACAQTPHPSSPHTPAQCHPPRMLASTTGSTHTAPQLPLSHTHAPPLWLLPPGPLLVPPHRRRQCLRHQRGLAHTDPEGRHRHRRGALLSGRHARRQLGSALLACAVRCRTPPPPTARACCCKHTRVCMFS